MPRQYRKVFQGKTARTLELLREEQEPKTPLEILIEEEDNEFDVTQKKHEHLVKVVRRALKSLTPKQRQCIRLYFTKNKKQVEIGEILGISHQAVSECLKSAKNNLKKSLKRYLQNG